MLEHGYWYARSPEVLQSDLVHTFVWARMLGDVLFIAGGVMLGVFVLRLLIKGFRQRAGVAHA